MSKKRSKKPEKFIRNFQFPPIRSEEKKFHFPAVWLLDTNLSFVLGGTIMAVIGLIWSLDMILLIITMIGGIWVRLQPGFHEIPLDPGYNLLVTVWLVSTVLTNFIMVPFIENSKPNANLTPA